MSTRGNSGANGEGRERAPRANPVASMDEHGQRMPFTREQFTQAFASSRRTGEQGNTGEARDLTINGQRYIAKVSTDNENLRSYGVSPELAVIHEAAARAIAQVAGMASAVPHESYHLTVGDRHVSVQSREAGTPITALSGDTLDRANAAIRSDPRHLLLDYVLGGQDRNDGNMLYDASNGKLTHIDFGMDLGRGAVFDGKRAEGRMAGANYADVTRYAMIDGGKRREDQVGLPKSAIHDFTARSRQILATAAKYNLPPAEMEGLKARLGVLKTLEQSPSATPKLADLTDIATRVDTAMGEPMFNAVRSRSYGERPRNVAAADALKTVENWRPTRAAPHTRALGATQPVQAAPPARGRGLFARLLRRGR